MVDLVIHLCYCIASYIMVIYHASCPATIVVVSRSQNLIDKENYEFVLRHVLR